MSLEYVLGTVRQVHPGATVGTAAGTALSTEYLLVPSATRPALVLPRRARRAAATACLRYAEQTRRIARLRARVLSWLFLTGAGDHLFRNRVGVAASSLEGLDVPLSRLLGHDVVLGFSVGQQRANRKPVLLALDRSGNVRGFVKLGINDLTDSLITQEGETLSKLATEPLGPVRVPGVLYRGEWGGHPMLVLEPLPLDLPRSPKGSAAVVSAMVAVATSGGTTRARLAQTPWWARVAVETFPQAGTDGERLVAAIGYLATLADQPLRVGRWHGDWNPGNFAELKGDVLVWDWERFADGVPVGWDWLHYRLWTTIPRGGRPSVESLEAVLDEAAGLLGVFGVDLDSTDLVATSYLVEIGCRLLRDDQRRLGVATGEISQWLLPVLERRLRTMADRLAPSESQVNRDLGA